MSVRQTGLVLKNAALFINLRCAEIPHSRAVGLSDKRSHLRIAGYTDKWAFRCTGDDKVSPEVGCEVPCKGVIPLAHGDWDGEGTEHPTLQAVRGITSGSLVIRSGSSVFTKGSCSKNKRTCINVDIESGTVLEL